MSNHQNHAQGDGLLDPTGSTAVMTSVRRRRTARTAAVYGGVLALAGASVLGATQLATAGVPTQPGQSASSELSLRGADQPELLVGTALDCGASFADLDLAEDVRLDATGDLSTETVRYQGAWSTYSSLPLRAADAAGADAPEGDLNSPTFVWVDQDGTVVDLGGWERYPMYLTHEDTGPQATEDRTSSCAPEGDQWLPDGTYDVYPMTIEYSTSTLVAGDPLPATIVNGKPKWAPGGQQASVSFKVPGHPDKSLVRDRSLGSVVVDRTRAWERFDTYRIVRPDADLVPGERYELSARCTSSDPDDKITYKLVGSWGKSGTVTGTIPCDGHDSTDGPWGFKHPVVPGSPVGVVFTDVPDGVALAYARLALAG